MRSLARHNSASDVRREFMRCSLRASDSLPRDTKLRAIGRLIKISDGSVGRRAETIISTSCAKIIEPRRRGLANVYFTWRSFDFSGFSRAAAEMSYNSRQRHRRSITSGVQQCAVSNACDVHSKCVPAYRG